MSDKAQMSPSDELGWLVDMMADPDKDRRLCPKACARAKAALLCERGAIRSLSALVTGLEAELAEARRSAEMACQNPPDRCDCPGCQFAAEVHREMEADK